MNFRIVDRPRAEPVSLDEIRCYLRVDSNDDDLLLGSLITVARSYCENYQRRAYMMQTLELTTDKCLIELPRSEELQRIEWVEINGEIIPDDWYTVKRCLLAIVELNVLTDKPVTVRYVTGVESAEAVQAEVKQAICLLVSHWYENRIAVITDAAPKELSLGVKALLDMGRVISL